MQGPEWQAHQATVLNEMSGILPRTGHFLFEEISRLSKNGFSCHIEAACFEIYCEEIRDLLTGDQDSASTNSSRKTRDLNWIPVKNQDTLSQLIH